MFKRICDILGDTRVSFVLLMAASATLFTGANYANAHYSFFQEMNRLSIPDWLAGHLKAELELTWWIPVLFIIMGALGLNTLVCVGNRVTRLISRRNTLSPGSFFHLLIPSIVHFLFIIIMLGHLTTFLFAKWQALQIETESSVSFGEKTSPLEVKTIQDLYFPETSGLRDRISQTIVTFVNGAGEEIELKYLHPVLTDGHFLFLDQAKEKKSAPIEAAPAEDEETCNKAADFVKKNKTRQLLLIVKDPGFFIIIFGLTLILCLMTWYFLVQEKNGRQSL